MLAAEGVTEGWCCWCVGSLNWAREDVLSGDSGFGDCVDIDVDVVVVRVARKSVVDDGVCSNGRASALRRMERANMVEVLCRLVFLGPARL